MHIAQSQRQGFLNEIRFYTFDAVELSKFFSNLFPPFWIRGAKGASPVVL